MIRPRGLRRSGWVMRRSAGQPAAQAAAERCMMKLLLLASFGVAIDAAAPAAVSGSGGLEGARIGRSAALHAEARTFR